MSNSKCQNTSGQPSDREASREAGKASRAVLESLITSSQPHVADADRPGLMYGAVIGTVNGWNDVGQPLVAAEEISDQTFPARTVIVADDLQEGMQVVLLFECGDYKRPIIMGVPSQPTSTVQPVKGEATVQLPLLNGNGVAAQVDDDRMVLTAEREIVLRCGKASLTLTRAGKVLIRGAYVISRSSGVNCIKGGSVQIN